MDQGARLLSVALTKELGASVVVENKPGANATMAGSEVVRARPDGLTLWFRGQPHHHHQPQRDEQDVLRPGP